MGSTLYVSNLPSSATEEELSVKFAKCGTVLSVRVMTDGNTGRSKGCGLVEMSSETEARTAIHRFNLADYDGRVMSVNLARAAASE